MQVLCSTRYRRSGNAKYHHRLSSYLYLYLPRTYTLYLKRWGIVVEVINILLDFSPKDAKNKNMQGCKIVYAVYLPNSHSA